MTVGEDEVRGDIRAFILERAWQRLRSPENLAKSISVEAGELLELFDGQPQAEDVHDELADVLIYCFQLADELGVDPLELMAARLNPAGEPPPHAARLNPAPDEPPLHAARRSPEPGDPDDGPDTLDGEPPPQAARRAR